MCLFHALRHAARTAGAALATMIALAGCGGGVYIALGDDDPAFDDPPNVSLVSSVDAAAPGTVITLSAAASDDVAVREVDLLRRNADGSLTALATDGTPAYRFDVALPDLAEGRVVYLARAVDSLGQTTDSNEVVVTLQR